MCATVSTILNANCYDCHCINLNCNIHAGLSFAILQHSCTNISSLGTGDICSCTISNNCRSTGRSPTVTYRIQLSQNSSSCIVESLSLGISSRNLRLLNVTQHRRHEDSSEDTDDCDYDDELYECEALNLVCFHNENLLIKYDIVFWEGCLHSLSLGSHRVVFVPVFSLQSQYSILRKFCQYISRKKTNCERVFTKLVLKTFEIDLFSSKRTIHSHFFNALTIVEKVRRLGAFGHFPEINC